MSDKHLPFLDTIVAHYTVTALWVTNDESTPEGSEPFDSNHNAADLSAESAEGMRRDVVAFYTANEADVLAFIEATGDAELIGYCLWLSANGHGTGFWDRDECVDEDLCERLHKASEGFHTDLYLGDDGQIHASRNGRN